MEEVHSTLGLQYKTFEKPDSITTAVICTKSGDLAIPGVCDHALSGNSARTEYFAKGTAPTKYCTAHIKVTICKESGHFASPYCPPDHSEDVVYLIKEETSPTDDTPFIYPTDQRAETCPLHSEGTVAPPVVDDEEIISPEEDDDENENEPITSPDDDSTEDDTTNDTPPVVIISPTP